jgi:hypothetical protein
MSKCRSAGLNATIEPGPTTFGGIIGPHFGWVGGANIPTWVLNDDDTFSMRIDATDGNFGASLALAFAEGDKITVIGRAGPVVSQNIVVNVGDWNPVVAGWGVAAGAPFNLSGTFTAAQATPGRIRIMGNGTAGDGAHFFIDSILVER